jgi:hypothetical protein
MIPIQLINELDIFDKRSDASLKWLKSNFLFEPHHLPISAVIGIPRCAREHLSRRIESS